MGEVEADTGARIVVGLDGSPASVAALRWAIREARFTGCTVDLVHVWTGSVSPFDLRHAQAGLKSERDTAREVLHTALERVRDANPDADVLVRSKLLAGYPSTVLPAETRGARTVVLGESKHDGLTRLLRKTVTQAVKKHAHCRVVTVSADGLLVTDTAPRST